MAALGDAAQRLYNAARDYSAARSAGARNARRGPRNTAAGQFAAALPAAANLQVLIAAAVNAAVPGAVQAGLADMNTRLGNGAASQDQHPLDMLPDAAGNLPPPALQPPATLGDLRNLTGNVIDGLLAFYNVMNPHPEPVAGPPLTPDQLGVKRFRLARHLGARL